MGGLHIYNDSGALGPLDVDTTIRLIANGHYLLPPRESIERVGKVARMGKCFALFELLQFGYSCMRRTAKGLPMATFEVMVLANSLIAVISFIPWWYRPMNIDSPDRISVEVVKLDPELRSQPDPEISRISGFFRTFPWWQIVFAYAFGNQDSLYSIRHMPSVPLFWSADPADIFTKPNPGLGPQDQIEPDAYFTAAWNSLIVIILFGLVHLLGWKSLTNEIEAFLWKIAVVVVTSAPAVIIGAFFLCVIPLCCAQYEWPMRIMLALTIPTTIFYTFARMVIVAVSVTSLWHLSPNVYKN